MELSLIILVTALLALIAVGFLLLRKQVLSVAVRDPEKFEHFIVIDDFEIFYQDVGNGPALLFLHGIGASTYTWRYQLNEFAKSHRVIIPDIPGFGRSSKLTHKKYDLESQRERLIQFINELAIEDLTIVGSSMGGLLALSLAEAMPSRVKKLILLAPATEPSLVPKGLYQASWTVHFIGPAISERMIKTIMKSVNANPGVITTETVKKYYEPYLDKKAMQTFVKATQTLRFKKTKQILKALDLPILILYGENDKRVPRWAINRLSQRLQNSRLQCHPNLGHHLHEDDPSWTNEKMHDFLSE